MRSITPYTKITLLVAALCISTIMRSGNPKSKRDTSLCLEVIGQLDRTEKKSDRVFTVVLICGNSAVDSLQVTEGKTFKFFLKKNAWYSINIKKDDYIPKLISINTNYDNVYRDYLYRLSFIIDCPITKEESKYLCSETIDFPTAMIEFDKTAEIFDYVGEYGYNIKKKLLEPIAGSDMEPRCKQPEALTVLDKEIVASDKYILAQVK